MSNELKVCLECKEEKNVSEFPTLKYPRRKNNKNWGDRLCARCKVCHEAHVKYILQRKENAKREREEHEEWCALAGGV